MFSYIVTNSYDFTLSIFLGVITTFSASKAEAGSAFATKKVIVAGIRTHYLRL